MNHIHDDFLTASAGIQTLLASKLALRIVMKSFLQRCALSPPINGTPQKLPPEFSFLMAKFSSKNPQDLLALISTRINNHVMADQHSVSDTFIFSWVLLTACTGSGLSESTFLARCWNHHIPQPHLIHQAHSPNT